MIPGGLSLLVLLLGDPVPVHAPVPAGADLSRPWRVVRTSDGLEVPAQESAGRIHWLHDGGSTVYRWEPVAPRPRPAVEVKDLDGKALEIRLEGRPVLRYASTPVPAAPGVDPVFERGGYLHPVRTPSGRVVTNDMPGNHLHHHGIWTAWTSSRFEGRPSNFWESKARQGKVETLRVEEVRSGPVFGGFRARHRFVNLNAPGGPKPALDETWELRVWATSPGAPFLFDLEITQTCAGPEPLLVEEYRYGGLGFRGAAAWEGAEGCRFLTSAGRSRADGHGTRARWCAVSGEIDGATAGLAILGHPDNFRHPQPMRIHPTEPFFNWAVPQLGGFRIGPGEPHAMRYRFVVFDGAPDAALLEARQAAFERPPDRALSR
jgi:hypothetical protein